MSGIGLLSSIGREDKSLKSLKYVVRFPQGVLEYLPWLHSEPYDIDVQSAFHEVETLSTMPGPRLTTILPLAIFLSNQFWKAISCYISVVKPGWSPQIVSA